MFISCFSPQNINDNVIFSLHLFHWKEVLKCVATVDLIHII